MDGQVYDTQTAATLTGIPARTLQGYAECGIAKPTKRHQRQGGYQWTSREATFARVAQAILGSTKLNREAAAAATEKLRSYSAGNALAFLAVKSDGSRLTDSRVIGADELPAMVLQGYLVFHASPVISGA